MSWQLASFSLLIAVVAGGFFWYERSRPSARLVALVAALAALAIAGRLVFAPVPNLVATTDIALLTGYALGGPPGFAVGALAAPVSNIWLGQGPWTAWQMAGWGMAGLLGAGAAMLSGRSLSRLGLALLCGFAGFAYGALLDLSVMVSYGGEQSLDRYLALSVRGIPFNVTHAVGNFAIALAAGPALVRMISRYRTRLEFSWRPAAAASLGVVLIALCSALAAPPPAEAAKSSVRWLMDSQNDDGGFAAVRNQPSNPAMTGWAMLGLEAAGHNPRDVKTDRKSAVDYLRARVDRLQAVGDLERSILALDAAGLDPHSFAGVNLVNKLRKKRDKDGSVDGQVNLTAFYVLAMRAADIDASNLRRSGKWLRRAQNDRGGWGIQPQAPSEADSTGAALQAVIAAGQEGNATERGVLFLRRIQAEGGGFSLATTGVVNTQSTAWAIQGLVKAGALGKPLDRAQEYMRRLKAADGHYRYSKTSDQTPVWVTIQALLAVRQKAFPLSPVAREVKTDTSSSGTGSGGTQTDTGTGDVPVPPITPTPTTPPYTPPSITPSDSGDFDIPPAVTDAVGDDKSAQEALRDATAGAGGPEAEVGGATPDSPLGEAAAEDGEDPAATPPIVAEEEPANLERDEPVAPFVAGGFGMLTAALFGGFLWYRNRLP